MDATLSSKIISSNQPQNVPAWRAYLPAILAIGGSFAMLALKLQIGERFVSDTALMMLALASYLMAAIF